MTADAAPLRVHLVDGTYELFRHFYAVPARRDARGREIGATRAVADSILRLLEDGATHVGVATDHVIDSFRNALFGGYKRDAGIEPALRSQFTPLEETLAALGVAVWPMTDYEADDALAAAARIAAGDPRVGRVEILTPDKDLAQCVADPRVVQVDRRRGTVFDEAAVAAKFGVPPVRIPDYLALVGDSADGFPGLPGFGAKGAAAVIARYGPIDAIPAGGEPWDVPGLRGVARLQATFGALRDEALLYRHLATLVTDGPAVGAVDDWRWRGPAPELTATADALAMPGLAARAERLAAARAG